MATTRKTTRKTAKKTANRRAPADGVHRTSDTARPSISESAQQIWLAGVGAFGRAQAEGSRLFDGLVKDGLGLEQTARSFATARAQTVRSAMETGVDQTRERAAETWDRFERVVEERVQRTLHQLGVPDRNEVQALRDKVDALSRELRARGGRTAKADAPAATGKAAPRKTAARKTAPRKATAPAKTAKKTAARTSPAAAQRRRTPASKG